MLYAISREEADEILKNQFHSETIHRLGKDKDFCGYRIVFFSRFFQSMKELADRIDLTDYNTVLSALDDFREIEKNRLVVECEITDLYDEYMFLAQRDGLEIEGCNTVLLTQYQYEQMFDRRSKLMKSNPAPEKPIMTYVMYDKSEDVYKIGRSINPVYRESTLRSQTPNIETLLICSENIELELHRKYKEKRIRGEWFRLSADDILDLVEIHGFKRP